MKKYIEFRVMKRTLFIIAIVVVMIGSACGYYVWSSYHPNIDIKINRGTSVGEQLKLDTPVVAVTGKWHADPASSVLLNINTLIMQHEYVIAYVKDTYQESNIALEIREKNKETVLNYSGTATTKDGEVVDFDRKITLDFVLHASMIYD